MLNQDGVVEVPIQVDVTLIAVLKKTIIDTTVGLKKGYQFRPRISVY